MSDMSYYGSRQSISRYIAWIDISPRIAQKIASKHFVTVKEVREAFQNTRLLRSGFELDSSESLRLLCQGTTYNGRILSAILYPSDREGTWRLATCFDAL